MLMILEKSQNFTYYAGIMLDAIAILLCSKLCWHNWLKPTYTLFSHRPLDSGTSYLRKLYFQQTLIALNHL